MGKAHGQIQPLNVLHADEPGIFHGPGKAIASGGIRRGAGVFRARFPQIFAADRLVTVLSILTAKPAAFIT